MMMMIMMMMILVVIMDRKFAALHVLKRRNHGC